MQHITSLSWPMEMRPGDERYVEKGITINSNSHAIRVEFIFDEDLYLIGAHSINKNIFVYPKKLKNRSFGIKYIVSKKSHYPISKDMSFIVYQRKFVWCRILLISILLIASLIPIVLQILNVDLLSFNINIGNFLIGSIPLGIVVSSLLSWNRILPVLRNLVSEDVMHYQTVGESGTSIGSIKINNENPKDEIRNWTPKSVDT